MFKFNLASKLVAVPLAVLSLAAMLGCTNVGYYSCGCGGYGYGYGYGYGRTLYQDGSGRYYYVGKHGLYRVGKYYVVKVKRHGHYHYYRYYRYYPGSYLGLGCGCLGAHDYVIRRGF